MSANLPLCLPWLPNPPPPSTLLYPRAPSIVEQIYAIIRVTSLVTVDRVCMSLLQSLRSFSTNEYQKYIDGELARRKNRECMRISDGVPDIRYR